MHAKQKTVGLTQSAGWQFGLRKTFPRAQQTVWEFMFSDEGLKIWLGELEDELTLKKPYNTKDGIQGIVRVFTPYSHIRMSWKKENWQNTSTVQVRVMGNREKSTVSFHHEKLSDETQREEVRLFWNEKMAEIEKILSKKI